MQKNYNQFDDFIEAGVENVSKHLSWLLRAAITTVCPKEGIVSVVYNNDLPKDIWGAYHGDVRGISINLEQHFVNAVSVVQDKEGMYSSIRSVILHDLLDTIIHEAHHAKKCFEGGDFTNSNLDEDGAKQLAWDMSWGFGENHDVNVESLGPLLDGLIKELYGDLKEYVLESDCKEWHKIQLHMLEHNLSYYNPDHSLEIRTIREAFEAHIQPEIPWMTEDNSLYYKYCGKEDVPIVETPEVIDITEPEVVTTQVVEPVAPIKPPAAQAVPTVVEPVIQQATVVTPIATTNTSNYNPLDDCSCKMDEEEAYVAPGGGGIGTCVQQSPTPVMQVETLEPVEVIQQVAVQAPTTQQPVMDVLRIQQIAEVVLRRMFHHIFTKCSFNTDGGFNNPAAVLEPVNISDIEGASALVTKQDTLDDLGKFQPHAEVSGFVKGLMTNDGRPKYTFYMNIGGELVKRSLMPANPNATKADGSPTNWAAQAKQGWKIMMLMPEKGGPTAHIKLAPNTPLGQEEFQIWANK